MTWLQSKNKEMMLNAIISFPVGILTGLIVYWLTNGNMIWALSIALVVSVVSRITISLSASLRRSHARVAIAKLPTTSPDLFGREKELAMLDAAWSDPETNIVALVAWGGVGKTALVNKWLLQMGDDKYRGAERVYGWSFYSQGAKEGGQTSADLFIAAALEWFGDPETASSAKSPWDKGERLAELVRERRTLLILDGLEPLQYPPGEMEGCLKDPGLKSLLKELAHHNPGLCVISTRLEVANLEGFVGTREKRIDLEHLSSKGGTQLLRKLEVDGTDDELKQAVDEFDGHALALTLLGKYLKVVYGGDIRKRDKIEKLTAGTKQGGHARRVMESYERWFEGKPELDILLIMGLFDRPAEVDAIEAVRAEPIIKGLTSELRKLSDDDWQFALNNLREARLLAPEDTDKPDSLDCHPLIREHFGEKLRESNPAAWREAHSRLYEYYKSSAEEFPDTIEEMAPLYAAVAHGCQAGRHQEAYDEVYRQRIGRGNEYFSVRKLGVFGTDLSAMSGFFDLPWSQPVAELAENSKANILNLVGAWLQALGRLAETIQPTQAGLEAYIVQRDWRNSAIVASNLSELHLTIGDVSQSLDHARQSVKLADRSGNVGRRMVNRTTLADALHQSGQLQESEASFREAEEMQKEFQPKYPLLYSVQGFQYCDLLLGQGKYQEVQNRAGQTLEWAKQANVDLLSIALDHLSLGRAHLLRAQMKGTDDFIRTADELDQAMDGLRQAGIQHFIARGLLGRAEFHRVRDDYANTQRDLDQAMIIATRGGMRLYEADCHLGYARLYLAMGEKEKARESLDEAKEMIEEMGYGRRRKDVEEIEGQF